MPLALTNNAVKESLSPEPNGVITEFYTSMPYKMGTVSVWQNGIRLIQDWDDGYVELGGITIRMNEAPLLGDTLQVEYEAA